MEYLKMLIKNMTTQTKYVAMQDVSFVPIELEALHINDVEAVQSRQKRVGTSRQL